MKKTFLLVLVIAFFATKVNSQITLAHSFSESVSYASFSINNVYYTSSKFVNNEIKFYNSDYSYNKAVTITPEAGYKLSNINEVSEHIFNTDDLIEFTVVSYDTVTYVYSMKLYNENGDMLYDFGEAAGGWFYQVDDELRFQFSDYETDGTKIYTLPGTLNGLNNTNITNNELHAYPNPSVNYVNLPYDIAQNQIVDLQIINSNGQIIEQKKIAGDFNEIRLNVMNYKPGIYFYKYNSVTKKFIVR